MTQPLIELSERFGAQSVDPKLCTSVHLDESDLPKDSQMSRDARTSDRQQCRQLANGGGTIAESQKDSTTVRVRKRLEYSVHGPTCNI